MKSTDPFKKVIQNELEEMAKNDELFAVNYKKENKNIDDCIRYILNTVKASGNCGFSDDEIYNMAVHYYDENDIKIGGDVSCKIVSNHPVQLTEVEIRDAKKEAIALEVEQQRSKLHVSYKKPSNKKNAEKVETQQSLF